MSLIAKFNVPWQQYNIMTGYKKTKTDEKEQVTRQLLDEFQARHSSVSISYNNKTQVATLSARNQKRFESAKVDFENMITNSLNDYHVFMEKVKQHKYYRNLQEFKRKERELADSIKHELLNKANAECRQAVKATTSTNSNNMFYLLASDGDDDSETEDVAPVEKIIEDDYVNIEEEEQFNDETNWMPVTKIPASTKSYRANHNKPDKPNQTESYVLNEPDSLQQLIAIDDDIEFPPLISRCN